MQLDPIKPTLKAPGGQRLKLKYEEPITNLAFKFNLRRSDVAHLKGTVMSVGRCRLNL